MAANSFFLGVHWNFYNDPYNQPENSDHFEFYPNKQLSRATPKHDTLNSLLEDVRDQYQITAEYMIEQMSYDGF